MSTKPIHIATVNGHRLRFFRSPNDDGRPDMPWHSVDDLHRCIGLNRAQRKYLLRSFHSMCKTVATADGIVTVGTHHMAHGCIEAAIADGRAPSSIRDDYAQAGADVLNKLIPPHRRKTPEALFAWVEAAMNRHEDAEPPR